jgi:3-oxoacyl-[acyl-carrier protein] reductase
MRARAVAFANITKGKFQMKALQEKSAAVTSKRLAGKVALVTGGSRGIGAGIARRLAGEGAHVAVSYARNQKAADDVVASLKELGVKALAVKADAASEKESQHLIEEVIKEFGKIDILVNNAGVFEPLPLQQVTLDHYNRLFDVNVKGVIATTIAALDKIAQGGRIINVSSVAATASVAGFSVYSATKAAVDTLTRIWAQELGSRQITVNAVAPGATASDMYDTLPEEAKAGLIEKTALRRVGQPEDIAALVAFLASEDGGWITGQSIKADGGTSL